MKYSVFKFIKSHNNTDFMNWKLDQLYKTEIIFVLFLTIIHAGYVFPDIIKLVSYDLTAFNLAAVLILRFTPFIIFLLGHILFINKKINIAAYNTFINNLAMLLSVIATISLKYYIPKEVGNPLGLVLIDSISAVMATIFSIPQFSIINLIICIITIFCSRYFIPNSNQIIKETIMNLSLVGFGLCVVSFSLDKYFKKSFDNLNQMKKMALEDNLTKLYNRNILKDRVFDRITERCKYNGSMIMIDIDHFKLINDSYGHSTGDVALCRLAAVLNENVRKDDYIVRFGGEEFLIILKDLRLMEAVSVAERIRTQVETMNFHPSFTISCGVSVFESNERFELATKMADDKLYEAKNTGRNKVYY